MVSGWCKKPLDIAGSRDDDSSGVIMLPAGRQSDAMREYSRCYTQGRRQWEEGDIPMDRQVLGSGKLYRKRD